VRLNSFFEGYRSGDDYDKDAITHVMACVSYFPGNLCATRSAVNGISLKGNQRRAEIGPSISQSAALRVCWPSCFRLIARDPMWRKASRPSLQL